MTPGSRPTDEIPESPRGAAALLAPVMGGREPLAAPTQAIEPGSASAAPRLATSVGQVPMDRLHWIFDGMFDGVWLVAEDGRTTYANRAMAGLLGSTPRKMRGRPMADFLDGEIRADVAGFLERQRVQAGERIQLRLRRIDGGVLIGNVAGSPITTADGTFVGTMLNVSDVTGKHSIDAQMVQNQRLEAIGQFAGGIAHDFNNLLTSIQGYTQLVMATMAPDDPNLRDMAQVIASADRASAITRKLLAFTRRQVLLPADVDPARVVRDLVPILAPLLGDGVTMVLDVKPGCHWVHVDPTQLEQVIMNLAVNARDAMPAGGAVTISIHDLEAPDPNRPDPDLSAGPFVRISVTDTGTGMDEITRGRIFDPFFTTKEPGKGTGFGLSTVFGIVGQSGGQIQVETSLGVGSTFHVDLPLASISLVPRPSQASAATIAAEGMVLVVEDDPAVREFTRRSLERAGYSVFAVAEAEQALRASEHWSARIDVLLTDLVMPGLRGTELAATIKGTRPDIGVVLMSGFADGAADPARDAGSVLQFLPKPFTVEALIDAVGLAAVAGRDRAARQRDLD
jgi:two-component system, cell cycle sensor histidine kinase and response regulator CckA